MPRLIVRFNGKEIKDVVDVSYLKSASRLRVVTRLNDKLVKTDYTGSIAIDVIGSEVDYKGPVNCVYRKSSVEFTGIRGRYGCISIDDAGYVKIVDKNLNWMLLEVGKTEVDRVRKFAEDGLGSLYVEVDSGGFGKIYNRAPGVVREYSEFIWSS